MPAEDALALYDTLEAAGAPIWIDGGWAVDANLGEQTRAHADLDIVIEERNVQSAVAVLEHGGYSRIPHDDDRAWNFVVGDGRGHEIDFHVIRMDAEGNGIYGPVENDDRWPAEALSNVGMIGDRRIRATSPRWLVASHTGYALKPKDWHDVSALCERFGLPVPAEYARFRDTTTLG